VRRAGTLATGRVVAPAVEEFAAELFLQGLGQIDGCGLGGAGSPHLLQQGRQLGLQGSEEILQSGFADVWLVGLGQDFPGAALDRLSAGQLGRLLAPQLDQPLQGRGETGEIVLAPGGLLFTYSCSGAVSVDLFQKIVAGAVFDASTDAQMLHRLAAGIDHPMSMTHPEGEYLKGLMLRRM
jgi:hypothetical protein